MTDLDKNALEAALLPCPFCGGPAELLKSYDSRRVACRSKDCFGPETSFFGLEADAIAAWNRRSALPQAAKAEVGGDLTALRQANIRRQAIWCPDEVPDLSFRGNELGGEVGEALNVIKKLERERLGWRGSRDTVEHLAEELADVVICADLCALSAGVDLAAAVVAKFNATSDKVGIDVKLASALAPSHPAAVAVTDEMVERAIAAYEAATPSDYRYSAIALRKAIQAALTDRGP